MMTIDHAQGNRATLKWLLSDGHGNPVRMMAPDYTLSGWQWRGVWGERTGSTPGRGYCANLGHPEDETGLVYMRARYYEPATGRFISEDPARDGINWYLYADGNPVGKVDSHGRASEFITGVFFLMGMVLTGYTLMLLMMTAFPIAEVQKGLPYYNFLKAAIKEIMGIAGIAAAAFGISAVGLATPAIVDYILSSLSFATSVLSALYSAETARALWTLAGVAVGLLVIQATVQLGILLSIGAENG